MTTGEWDAERARRTQCILTLWDATRWSTYNDGTETNYDKALQSATATMRVRPEPTYEVCGWQFVYPNKAATAWLVDNAKSADDCEGYAREAQRRYAGTIEPMYRRVTP